jgi:hypothetical protein
MFNQEVLKLKNKIFWRVYMKIALNLGIKNGKNDTKYIVHAILDRENVNLLTENSPYFVSINFDNITKVKKTYYK